MHVYYGKLLNGKARDPTGYPASVYYKGSLCTYHILMGMLIPRAFVTPLPHADRPAPRCIEDEEELERAVLRKRAAKMKKALERAGV